MLVADADPLPVSQFLREVGAAMDRRVRLVAVPSAVLQLAAGLLGRKADLKRLNGLFEISGMRASQELGWLPRYSTRDELRVAVRAESH